MRFTMIGSAGIMLVALIVAHSLGSEQSVLDATCKVSTSAYGSTAKKCSTGTRQTSQPAGSVGTGFAFFKSDDYVWVMTNRHVVGENSQGKTVYTTWWSQGRQSRRLPMLLVAVSKKYDVAIGKIKVALFGRRLPRIIPLADVTPVDAGDTILTAGCPNGDWSTVTRGHVTKPLKTADGTYTSFLYLPSPRDGRSGSPVFNAEGTEVIGLCYLRVGGKDGTRGQAYSTLVLRSVFPKRGIVVDGKSAFPFGCREGRCLPQRQQQQAIVVSDEQGLYPGLPDIDIVPEVETEVELEIAETEVEPEVEQVGWVAPTIISIIAAVFGSIILLGRQLFGKLGT